MTASAPPAAPVPRDRRQRRLEATAGWLTVPRLGPVSIRRLLALAPDPRDLLQGDPGKIAREAALPLPLLRAAREALRDRTGAAQLEAARARGARVLFFEDPDYPAALRHASAPPPLLYLHGEGALPGETDAVVTVVGTRRATAYGLEVAERIAEDLARRGVLVVSGFARGIDSAAHRGCLEGAGRTIAVLGTGIDRVYPAENRRLAVRVRRRGLLVSELAFGAAPLPEHFPRRNRILAALAQVVVVVEAGERSGALTTAGLALDLGREVVAVPGPVTNPRSRGTFLLLRDGAAPVGDAEDIVAWLERVGHPPPATRARVTSPPDDSPALDLAGRILALLGEGPRRAEEIAGALGIDPTAALVALGELELAGEVRRSPGARVARTARGSRRRGARAKTGRCLRSPR